MAYHVPVLLKESIEGLAIKNGGTYVDVTFGGGGHSREILKGLGENGKLFAFDQDRDAAVNAQDIGNRSFTLIEANFRYLKRYLKANGVAQVDGILADLGVSSFQINEAVRGFSTRFDAVLDMRMDQSGKKSARDVVNEYSEESLHKILGMYGEVRNAKTLAAMIIKCRVNKKIETVEDLKKILLPMAPRKAESNTWPRYFRP